MTNKNYAPQYYIRIFSRGLGEINPTNVISIHTSMSTTSNCGDFSIELDYRNAGLGALDYFFRIEPQDYVEIYMRREYGKISRWTEVREVQAKSPKTNTYFTEEGKRYLRRNVSGEMVVCESLDGLNLSQTYRKHQTNHMEIEGLDLFSEIKTKSVIDPAASKDSQIEFVSNPTKSMSEISTKKITIAKLPFIKNLPLTPSERLYNPDLVMVGLVDDISNSFALNEDSTNNNFIIKGRTLSKFLINNSYNADLSQFYASLGILSADSSVKASTMEDLIYTKVKDRNFSKFLLRLWRNTYHQYTSLCNISPAGAAIKIFEEYVALVLGNLKPSEITWGSTTKAEKTFHCQYNIPVPDSKAIQEYLKLQPGELKRNKFLGVDTSLIEIENPNIDPDIAENNDNLEIVENYQELLGTKGYTFMDDKDTMATLHFYDAPWTHIFTSYVNSDSLSTSAITTALKNDPISRLSPYTGSNFARLDNPGLGNGAFFGTTYSILERLTNNNLNEFFIDEKGFMVLRKQVIAYDQTRFTKKSYEDDVKISSGKCFVDKKYSSYIGLEDEYNRLIIPDGDVIGLNFQRNDNLLSTVVMIRPTMLSDGTASMWYEGFRSTMPAPIGYLESLGEYIADKTDPLIKSSGIVDATLGAATQLINNQLPEYLQISQSDKDSQSQHTLGVVRKKVIDTLYRNKFNSIFSPPILNYNQIANFWQRNGYRSNIIDDFHSHTPVFGLLTASEIFSKFNNCLWSGTASVKGDPKYRAGKVIELPGIPAKFYTYSVSHDFIWGESYKTTLGITAGRLIKNSEKSSKEGIRNKNSKTMLSKIQAEESNSQDQLKYYNNQKSFDSLNQLREQRLKNNMEKFGYVSPTPPPGI